MSDERGGVVIALDPFEEGSSGRPFLIASDEETPFHGERYVMPSITTRTRYDERIPLDEEDW